MQGSGWIPARDDSIRLPDGRALAYAEWGDLGGRPVFYFHGMPGSRLFIPDPDAAADEHVRVIAADRPGMGRSDPQPGHVVTDWPSDVNALADALGLERFGVIGWSAGTPYAFACAALIPERLTAASATTSAAAMRYLIADDLALRDSLLDDDDRSIFEALPQGRDAARSSGRRSPPGSWSGSPNTRSNSSTARATRATKRSSRIPRSGRASSTRSARPCVRGPRRSRHSTSQIAPWGFRLEDITIPVHVWASANDRITPPERMRLVAEKIPRVEFTVWPDVGHAGIAKYFRDVLREL